MYRKILQFAAIFSVFAIFAHAQVTVDPGAVIRTNESTLLPGYWMSYGFGPVTYTSMNNGQLIGDATSGSVGSSFETHGSSFGLSINWSISIAANGELLLTYSWTVGISSKSNKTVHTGKYATGLPQYQAPYSPSSTSAGTSSGGDGGFIYDNSPTSNSGTFDYYYDGGDSSPTGSVTFGDLIILEYMD